MTYHFINDDCKINFDLPEGVEKIIKLVEKLDQLNDHEYFSYASTLKATVDYYVSKGEISKTQQKLLNKRYPAL